MHRFRSRRPPTGTTGHLLAGLAMMCSSYRAVNGWRYRAAPDTLPPLDGHASAGNPGDGRDRGAARRADLSHRPRHGAGLQHRHRQDAGRWRTGEGRLHRRPGGQGGRPAGADRSPPVPGQLDQAVAKKVQDEANLVNAKLDLQRFTDLAPRSFAPSSVDTQRARWPSSRRRSRAIRRRSTARRSSSTTPPSPRRFRPDRHPARRSGQHRPCDRHHRPRRRHPAAADLGRLHPARGELAAVQSALKPVRSASSRSTATTTGSWPGHARAHRQPDRSVHRDDPPQGDLPQPEPALWPGQFVNMRLLARTRQNVVTVPSTRCSAGRRLLRLCRQARQHGRNRPLKVGPIGDGIAVVEDGMQPARRSSRPASTACSPARRRRYEPPSTATAGAVKVRKRNAA